MKNTFKETKMVGKAALEFCDKSGIKCSSEWIAELKDRGESGELADNGYNYRIKGGVVVVTSASEGDKFAREVRITRKQGPYGLTVIVKSHTSQVYPDCKCTTAKEYPDDKFMETTVYRDVDGKVHVPNSTPEKEEIVRELYKGIDNPPPTKPLSEKDESPVNVVSVPLPKSPQKSVVSVVNTIPGNGIETTPVRVYHIKELDVPMIFTKRRIHNEDVYEVKIDYTPQSQAMRTQLINYCVAMLRYVKCNTELDFVEKMLFEDGFIYEDSAVNSSIAMAHIQAHQFMMKNKATHIQVLEINTTNQNGSWGCNTGSMYKNLFRLTLTLLDKEVK